MCRFFDAPRLVTALVAMLVLAPSAFAQRLPGDVTPSHYDLSFDVDLANARFTGTETIRVNLSQPTRSVTLNAAATSPAVRPPARRRTRVMVVQENT